MSSKLIFVCLALAACTMPEEKLPPVSPPTAGATSSIQSADTHIARNLPAETASIPVPPPMRQPLGFYQAVLPIAGTTEQTVLFNPDFTYRLQEHYREGKKDSTVMVSGNWLPSDGYIWLYKDQVVRARYRWKGDTLQYYSPLLKKSFALQQREPIARNSAWTKMQQEGVQVFGTGTEPFWNIALLKGDSLAFSLPEWSHPLTVPVTATNSGRDSTAYEGRNDSTSIRLTVFPYFCSDGMSDFIYTHRVRVQYNTQVYNGCATLFK